VLLPTRRLRFIRHDEQDLRLLYGNDDLDAPQYDLALLATHLRGSAAEEAILSPSQPLKPPSASRGGTIAFWVVLAGAVLALGVLLVRLLRRE
jgi:hypothetical protein